MYDIKLSGNYAISKRPRLTKGQEYLFLFIQDKLKTDERLTFAESKEMYIQFGNRNVINGVPHKYNYWVKTDRQGEYTCELEPMTYEDLQVSTLTWLTQNIGSLVLKGYLKVLPALELE